MRPLWVFLLVVQGCGSGDASPAASNLLPKLSLPEATAQAVEPTVRTPHASPAPPPRATATPRPHGRVAWPRGSWAASCSTGATEACQLSTGASAPKALPRGTLDCSPRGPWLVCLWTHVNGAYQACWVAHQEDRTLISVPLDAWGSDHRVVSVPTVVDGQLHLDVASDQTRRTVVRPLPLIDVGESPAASHDGQRPLK